MATNPALLSLEEFHANYSTQKPYYEYWFGKAVQKAMPTRLHSLLQFVLLYVIDKAGYAGVPELTLRIDPNWEPVPDVAIMTGNIQESYPTRAREIPLVVEVLSPDDRPADVIVKCRNYSRIDIRSIYVFDPIARTAKLWYSLSDELVEVDHIDLPNGKTIPLKKIWLEFDRRIKRQAATS